MGMRKALIRKKQVLEAEMRKREIMTEMDARKQAKVGAPNVIEEQHEDVSWQDRLALKNLGRDANSNAAYIAKNNPQLDTRVWDGRVLVKRKNETDWKTLDPDAEGFDGFGEFAKDIGDVAYDVGAGVIEGVGTAAAAAVPALFGGAGLSVPSAMAANAALGGTNEAIRQKLGDIAGLHEGVDMGDVGTTAVLSGAIPLVPGAVMKGLKGAKNVGKGTAKFLAGVDEETIQAMTREGEKKIARMEAETVVPTLEKMSQSVGDSISDIQRTQIEKVRAIKNELKLENDEDVIKVLSAELDSAINKKDYAAVGKLEEYIKDVSETADVRKTIDDIGFSDPELVRRTAYPDSVVSDEIGASLPDKMKGSFAEIMDDLGGKFQSLYKGKNINVEFMDDFVEQYINKTIPPVIRATDNGKAMESAIRKFYQKSFKVNNKGNIVKTTTNTKGGSRSVPYKAKVSITPEQMAEKGIPRDKFLPRGQDYDALVDRVSNFKEKSHSVKGVAPKATVHEMITGTGPKSIEEYKELPSFVSADDLQYLKNIASEEAKYGEGLAASIAPKKLKATAKFARGLEREMTKKLDDVLSDRTSLGSDYAQAVKARSMANKMFKDEASSIRNINQAIKGNVATLNKIREIDKATGSNFAQQIENTTKAIAATEKGVGQAKAFQKATAYADELANKSKTEVEKIAEKHAGEFKDASGVSKAITKYVSETDAAYNAELDRIVKEYGPEAGKAFKEYIEDLKLSAVFGDTSKTKMKEVGGEQTGSSLSAVLQGAAWQLPGGAAMSRIGGTVGKAMGSQVPVRKFLRKTLPVYFEKKKSIPESVRRKLEKSIGDTIISRRDAIRQLAKEIGREE